MSSEKKAETLSFEAALEQLQSTVRQLESGELTLEEALKNFEEGVKLTRLCQEQLIEAEQRIEVLTQSQTQADAPAAATTESDSRLAPR